MDNSRPGLGFAGLLALLFIALKLMGYITWSWWLVLSPLWAPMVLVLVIAVVVALVGVVIAGVSTIAERR